MYLTPTEKHWVFDIETDGLNPSVIWIATFTNAVTEETYSFTDTKEIRQFIESRLAEGAIFVGHNVLGFDAPVLNRLAGCKLTASRLVDTFVLSMLYSPSIAGGHSLDDWATRLGKVKPAHEEWDRFSEEMRFRNTEDVAINKELFVKLTKRMRDVGFTETGAELEHKAWVLIRKQKKNGFYFDYKRAHILYAELRALEKEIEQEVFEVFPPTLECIKTYAKAFKKDGSPTSDYQRHSEVFEKLVVHDNGTYSAYDWVSFNLGSPQQRVAKLLELGWVPREFTPKTAKGGGGNPKPTDEGKLSPSLEEFVEESGIKEVRLIAEWMAINGRANAINTWMNAYNPDTECIHGNLWLARTLRYRHDGPNTANIPAVRLDKDGRPVMGREGFFTYEARDLWSTRDRQSRRLVGVDAKGIQLRNLAHYLNDPAFTEAILSADPHAANQQRMNLPTRALTKTITYATLMGAGDPKIASEARIPLKEAKEAKRQFFEQLPELPNLIKKLKRELKNTGRITLCDGSRIMVPSDHMVIPFLLQGDESRIMKKAGIIVDQMCRKQGLDVLKVGDIHDEWQSDVHVDHVDAFIKVCQQAFKQAGEFFGYNLPIDCDAKVGFTWAETH